MKYVAFLRGINVGGNTKVSMTDLKKVFESLDFTNVKTILNSGNIVFEGDRADLEKIETALEKKFGFKIRVMIRTTDHIKQLIESDPFKGVKVTPDTRFYITFFADKPKTNLKLPYQSEDKEFQILKVSDGEVISFLILSPKRGTLDLMSFIEKEFSKDVTTRNWNTLLKIAAF